MWIVLVAVAALLAAGSLMAYFLGLEAAGRRHVVVLIVLGFLFVEMLFQPDGINTDLGLLRIPLGPFDARPADVIIPLAVAARALSAPMPKRVSIAALIWTSFSIWYTVAAVVGVLNGHAQADVIVQLRGVLIGAGLLVLVAGIDIAKFVANDRLPRIGRAVGTVGVVLLVTHLSEITLTFNAPVIGFNLLGALGSDARTLFPILGMMAIIVDVTGGRRRISVVLPSLALVATPVASTQGGPYLSLLILLVSLTIVALGATWRRRLSLTALDIGFILSLVLAVGAISVFASGGETPTVVDQFEEAVLSDTQSTTTSERFLLWSDALDEIEAAPLWGSGLGTLGTIERPFPAKPVTTTFHNVFFDISARSGLVGLGLFLAALSATVGRALATWRNHRDPFVAAIAMTSMLGILAILGRALVSSSLEHTRVAVALFVLIGLVLAAEKSDPQGPLPADDATGRELSGIPRTDVR